MQIVPTVFPYREGIGRTEQPPPITPVLAAKRVGARSIPPMVFLHFQRRREKRRDEQRQEGDLSCPSPAPIERRKGGERRQIADRRVVCRRVTREGVLLDTRSGDRRRGRRRETDLISTAIDVEA
jgi:hypothetical protein